MFGSGLDVIALLAWLTTVALVVGGILFAGFVVITTLRQRRSKTSSAHQGQSNPGG
jgi:hypothetical protein